MAPQLSAMAALYDARIKNALRRRPYLHWVAVYAFGLTFFLCYRLLALEAIVHTFGAKLDNTIGNRVLGLALGFCEDVVCVTYMATLLWLVDWNLSRVAANRAKRTRTAATAFAVSDATVHSRRRVYRFVGYFIVVLFATIHSVANGLLVRIRQMRFTIKFIEMYINQRDAVAGLEVSTHEQRETEQTVVITLCVLLAFSAFASNYLDLSLWDPTQWVLRSSDDGGNSNSSGYAQLHAVRKQSSEQIFVGSNSNNTTDYWYNALEHGNDRQSVAIESLMAATDANNNNDNDNDNESSSSSTTDTAADDAPTCGSPRKLRRPSRSASLSTRSQQQQRWWFFVLKTVVLAIVLVVMPLVLLVIVQQCVPPVVAMIGLNTSLSEFFRLTAGEELLRDITDGSIASAHLYLDNQTESYELFRTDALYRRTLGFQGDVAFDVAVDQTNLPNVLVIVVESFRYHDSQYLVANNTHMLKHENLTVTPHFDRWAKRGIAFRNFWSNWQTSRSLESIVYGQLPFESVTETGTTTGHANVALSGLPQLFKAKGYETNFVAGCRVDYDQWNEFLPTHGFDDVIGMPEVMQIAENELGIDPSDWALTSKGGKSRAMSYWGVHDDVALDVLGNILLNKTAAQQARVAKQQPKQPFFMTSYTISSHTPYIERPEWYEHYDDIPDFSRLYHDEPHAEHVRRYMELRYFTDLALGKFLDRMKAHGVLDDTLVVIVGDHGQGPEFGKVAPEYREISTARVAALLIAEGRLGDSAGLLVDRVGEHYDLLNTLADIVGVPDGGFLQTGVGRSLKRKASTSTREAQHVVWSNNPVRKMGVVRGHERLQYDVMTDQVALHNTETDHDMQHDLFPALSPREKQEWLGLRDAGRRVSAYYKKRWMKKCLLKPTC